jgi:hypothetical protein
LATTLVYTDNDDRLYNGAELIGLINSDSTQNKVLGDVSSVPTSVLSTNVGNSNYSLDEDFSTLAGKYTVINTASPFKALTDSELPAGEGGGGGPTTTQIWKTG